MSAVLILGGASRTGKSLISRELLPRLGVPYLSIDPIKMALSKAVPSYPLDTDASSIAVSEQLWPFVRALLINMHETGLSYLVEGEVLPWQVAQLSDQLGFALPACFVGYQNVVVSQHVAQIKRHYHLPNSWTIDMSDADLHRLVEEGVDYSRYLCAECERYGLYYQDFSVDFDTAKAAVIAYFERAWGDKYTSL
ncbi:hypothetical protein ABMA57_08155 [Saccharospirillum sp. HFRX-1]|uniref:hypothetical protein n=1 Tax=unclassified Saccharospirillum TaxID=2633430 RepID=UPI0037158703